MTKREKILELAKQAGINPARIREIENGCASRRIQQILWNELGACAPGTLVLSDPDSALKAIDIAYSM